LRRDERCLGGRGCGGEQQDGGQNAKHAAASAAVANSA
jgi:hypothetical protein